MSLTKHIWCLGANWQFSMVTKSSLAASFFRGNEVSVCLEVSCGVSGGEGGEDVLSLGTRMTRHSTLINHRLNCCQRSTRIPQIYDHLSHMAIQRSAKIQAHMATTYIGHNHNTRHCHRLLLPKIRKDQRSHKFVITYHGSHRSTWQFKDPQRPTHTWPPHNNTLLH